MQAGSIETILRPSDKTLMKLQNAFAAGKLKPGLNIPYQVIEKKKINNVEGMNQQLEQIKLNMEWTERLDIVSDMAPMGPEIQTLMEKKEDEKSTDPDDSNHNEFKLEMKFYRQAQAAVLEGISRLHKKNIATKRPIDYLAEMVKADVHMNKIRAKLLSKKTNLENSQKAKKLRELRKQGKKIQHQVLQDRQKEKKDMMEAVKKYRKGDGKNLDFLENSGKGKPGTSKQNNSKSAAKRIFKEGRYGYGGKKKGAKYNTGKSSADMSGFSSKKNSKPTSNKRLGKSKRQKLKNRKKK
ncbi:putative rRNA-processing protein EBP2 [Nymphon striatum]|nr:putative rRNA-processing protein EBP2 [Nymphon striatum]